MKEIQAIIAAIVVFCLVAGPFAYYDAGVHRGLFEPLSPLKYGLVAAIVGTVAIVLAGQAYNAVRKRK